MKYFGRVLIILTLMAFICPAVSLADIVYIKNEDKLRGALQSSAFSLMTPYGKFHIEKDFIKSISFIEGSAGQWAIETINNDRFSGMLLTDSIQFVQEDGKRRKINKNKITRVWREYYGPSQPTTTSIVIMKNNDRFSAKFISGALEIRANFITRTIQPKDINRIEFAERYQNNTKILLENGDLITGILKQNHFLLAPDSVSALTVSRNKVKSIQFNAPKMILRAFNHSAPTEADEDGDGIPDYADLCMGTPAGAEVGMDGCARRPRMSRTAISQKINGYQKDLEKSLAADPGQVQQILFDFDRVELKPRYFSALDEAAVMLRRLPLVQAEIHGHTDNIGTEEYNHDLSMRRARKVKDYLVQKGVEKERLIAKGFGFTRNNASNNSEAGRALNRRVEILMVNKRLASHH